jgi:protein O-mannosyl-transferase
MSKINKSILITIAVILAIITYSNHFNNAFQFDDDHTIVTNLSIRNIKNIPTFFTDATTTSSLPASQAYRPALTTLNAIDTFIGGKSEPVSKYFHISIFISFILMGFAFFKFCEKIFAFYFDQKTVFLASLFATTWFWLHTANSACINYIITRADSFSTFMVVLGFVIYIYLPKTNRFYLYLIPVALGFLVKEPAVMFVPLFFVYKLLFEQNQNLIDVFTKNRIKLWQVFKECLVPFAVILVLVLFSRKMTPEIWTSGTTNVWGYLISQPFVIFHYFNNFFLPFNLVIDTDWTFVEKPLEDKVIIGTIFIIGLIYIIFKTSKNHKPISFGIAWFLLALVPSSSVFPLSEVLNDHRPFFAYIGLFIAVVYGMIVMFQKYNSNKLLLLIIPIILICNSIGTYNQNKKWITNEEIWKDATINAPRNGRAWMNYGNALMSRADYAGAEIAFNKTIQLWPYYPYGFVNIGVLKNAQNKDIEAETNFKKAIELDSINPGFYVLYYKFLIKKNRIPDAKECVNKGLALTPNHSELLTIKKELDAMQLNGNDYLQYQLKQASEIAKTNPTHESYLELSLKYYNNKQFLECIKACQKSLALKPDYAPAYNNICSAYNELQQWSKAAEAGKKGLAIDPNNALLQGNLNVSLSNLKK